MCYGLQRAYAGQGYGERYWRVVDAVDRINAVREKPFRTALDRTEVG